MGRSPVDAQRAKDLFLEALDLEGEARDQLLTRTRAEDADLGARVDALLAAHEKAEEIWSDDAPEVAEEERPEKARAVGGRVGDYDLLEEVGSGSSGVVWKARQVSGARNRAV